MSIGVRASAAAVLATVVLSLPAFAQENASEFGPGTYKQVQAFMNGVAQKYSSAKIFDLGASDSGETIQGLRIGNGPVKNLVVATHHGNEYGSTEVAKAFAESVAANPIANQTVYVIPVLNINGYNTNTRTEMANGRSWDPNRNYPGPCGTEGPFTLKDTQALANFVDREQIVASATLHTFYPVVAYPWGIDSHDLSTPYDDLFRKLSAAAVQETHYQTGNSTQTIYPADGTFEDYSFWKHGMWTLLFELGYSHSPSSSDVQAMIQGNVPGLRRMLEQAPTKRADKHDFTGHCNLRFNYLDRHDE